MESLNFLIKVIESFSSPSTTTSTSIETHINPRWKWKLIVRQLRDENLLIYVNFDDFSLNLVILNQNFITFSSPKVHFEFHSQPRVKAMCVRHPLTPQRCRFHSRKRNRRVFYSHPLVASFSMPNSWKRPMLEGLLESFATHENVLGKFAREINI